MALETKAKLVFAWLFITSLIYFSVQTLVTHSYSFLTPLDSIIPFVPEFIWPYHTLMPVIIGTTIFSMHRRQVFFNTIVALTVSALVLTIFHILFPSFYPRQDIEPVTSFFSVSLWLVELTREFDAACNTFPSGHVAFAWVLYFCIGDSDSAKRRKGLEGIYLLWAVLISMSTLFLKQHYVFDVISGIAVAYVCASIAKKTVKNSRYLCDATANP